MKTIKDYREQLDKDRSNYRYLFNNHSNLYEQLQIAKENKKTQDIYKIEQEMKNIVSEMDYLTIQISQTEMALIDMGGYEC